MRGQPLALCASCWCPILCKVHAAKLAVQFFHYLVRDLINRNERRHYTHVLVRVKRLELPRLSSLVPKTSASTNSAIPAFGSLFMAESHTVRQLFIGAPSGTRTHNICLLETATLPLFGLPEQSIDMTRWPARQHLEVRGVAWVCSDVAISAIQMPRASPLAVSKNVFVEPVYNLLWSSPALERIVRKLRNV